MCVIKSELRIFLLTVKILQACLKLQAQLFLKNEIVCSSSGKRGGSSKSTELWFFSDRMIINEEDMAKKIKLTFLFNI